jgi:hypothetical protein
MLDCRFSGMFSFLSTGTGGAERRTAGFEPIPLADLRSSISSAIDFRLDGSADELVGVLPSCAEYDIFFGTAFDICIGKLSAQERANRINWSIC